MMRRLSWKLTEEDQELTLEQLMRKRLGLTRAQISRAKFTPEGILLAGERKRVSQKGKAGELLEIALEERKASEGVVPCPGELDILYEDQDLLAVNKPAGTPSHPGRGHYLDSLANRVVWHLEKQGEAGIARLAGRLDKDTSGIVIFAKNQIAAQRLAKQKEQGIYRKTYLALTKGRFSEKEGRILEPIGPVPGEKQKMRVCPEGKAAHTEYQVLKSGEDWSLLQCRIYTGRTHQIRVHMAWLGHPLLGDALYGTGENPFFPGLALHCERAELALPFTGERLTLQAKAYIQDKGKLSEVDFRRLG